MLFPRKKSGKHIEFVLATDLRNREIVLGKFVARLLHLTTLLLAGLPILSALQFMGGIDPNLLLAGFAGTGLTMLSIAGVSIFASTISRRTRDALLIVYLSMLAYVGLWLLCEVLNGYWGASTFPRLGIGKARFLRRRRANGWSTLSASATRVPRSTEPCRHRHHCRLHGLECAGRVRDLPRHSWLRRVSWVGRLAAARPRAGVPKPRGAERGLAWDAGAACRASAITP